MGWVSPWQAVAGAWPKLSQLRQRVQEVEDLWQKEEHEGLGEVTQDATHGHCHASEVAARVANKDTRGVPG